MLLDLSEKEVLLARKVLSVEFEGGGVNTEAMHLPDLPDAIRANLKYHLKRLESTGLAYEWSGLVGSTGRQTIYLPTRALRRLLEVLDDP